MGSQRFTHENEILAFAPLKNDPGLFEYQKVWINQAAELQWDFILPNGKDWHFSRKAIFFPFLSSLRVVKDHIERMLLEEVRIAKTASVAINESWLQELIVEIGRCLSPGVEVETTHVMGVPGVAVIVRSKDDIKIAEGVLHKMVPAIYDRVVVFR